jgi:hypothetical protein
MWDSGYLPGGLCGLSAPSDPTLCIKTAFSSLETERFFKLYVKNNTPKRPRTPIAAASPGLPSRVFWRPRPSYLPS